MKQKRKMGGKLFSLLKTEVTKKAANQRASLLRRSAYRNVRVTGGPGRWSIWGWGRRF